VYCPQCGANQEVSYRFCSSCGYQVLDREQAESILSADSATDDAVVRDKEERQPITAIDTGGEEMDRTSQDHASKVVLFFMEYLWLLIPLTSFIAVISTVGGIYFYEKNRNEQVKELRGNAEMTAFNREYEKALAKLDSAIKLRPNYALLMKERGKVQAALQLENDLQDVDQLIKERKFKDATQKLNGLQQTLSTEKGELFTPFDQEMKDREYKITLGRVQQEIDGLKTVDELANRLTKLEPILTDESLIVQKQIINNIIQITTKQVEGYLKNNDFTTALSVIEKGLSYSKDEATLLALKKRVQDAKVKFEKAEQERLERAMEAAAKEDLLNRTAAVEIVSLKVDLNYYGDLYVYGDVKNVSTTGIYNIRIYYSVYNAYGDYLGERNVLVTPNFLSPGQIGEYEDIIYGVNIRVNVEIDNITWYLE
jgi:Tfp pilus assembly major pilin PilA